jgi:hypothetical protein
MATLSGRHQMITFKAEEALVEAMEHIPNRSEFIRSAILAALEGVCPLCHGTGVLNPNQQRHWHEFSQTHRMVRCSDCAEGRLVCTAAGE